jgi:hypothetical protein
VKDDVVAAGYVDVGQMQERRHSFLGYRVVAQFQKHRFSGPKDGDCPRP